MVHSIAWLIVNVGAIIHLKWPEVGTGNLAIWTREPWKEEYYLSLKTAWLFELKVKLLHVVCVSKGEKVSILSLLA